jgi:uncharacterized protein YjbJ (UPF0337 family)
MDTDRIKGTAQELGGKLEKAAGDLTDDTGTQASGVIRQVAGRAQDLYGQAKDSLPDVMDTASGYANQAYDQSGHYARRGVGFARKEIEEYPMVAVLLAGAIGYLLALLIHGGRR